MPCFVLVFSFLYWSYGLAHYYGIIPEDLNWSAAQHHIIQFFNWSKIIFDVYNTIVFIASIKKVFKSQSSYIVNLVHGLTKSLLHSKILTQIVEKKT